MTEHFGDTPIQFDYAAPSKDFVEWLRSEQQVMSFAELRVREENCYRAQGLRGASQKMLARSALVERLRSGLERLDPSYEFVLFDTYRSRATQLHLFEIFKAQIHKEHPELDEAALHTRTQRFVAHPDETSRFKVAPHNSGGAADLSLAKDGKRLDMGTEFDDLTERAATDYFEQPWPQDPAIDRHRWESVRRNRRLLFNLMKQLGFVNYDAEWWHYDLGDCIWAEKLGTSWHYPSMEKDVDRYKPDL